MASPHPRQHASEPLGLAERYHCPPNKVRNFVFHVFAALAEFERDIIRERTRAGLEAARARGKRGGRPRKLDAKKKTQARTLHNDKTNTIADICRTLRIGRTTLYRYLAEGRTNARQLPE